METSSKTVRFASVVGACGTPEPLTLWVDPDRDPGFRKAVRENRVMSVFREKRGKAEAGRVGFEREKKATYLVFPKPLTAFRNRKVIGIRYELSKEPEAKGPIVRSGRGDRTGGGGLRELPRSRRVLQEREQSEFGPKTRLYKVTVKFMATVEVQETVEADDRKSAREQVLREVKVPDLRQATITKRVTRVAAM